jgi:RNA polymerase sigma-70 factor (ECF subfamily)
MAEPAFLNSLDDRLKQALMSIAPEYREIVILNVIGDMAYKDIAETLEVPIGTVMSRLSRAKSMLRERLVELGREVLPNTDKRPLGAVSS